MLGYGNTNPLHSLLSAFGSPSEILKASDEALARFGLTPAQIKRKGAMEEERAQKIIKLCEKENVKILSFYSVQYPDKLRFIENPPVVLYALGNVACLNSHATIAIIGTRKISEYGKRAAFSLSARLSLGNAVIVSGGAKGGDEFAHLGALSVSGKTVNVTGGGVLSDYLKANKPLRESIIKFGGVLVSEFEPTYTPRGKFSFGIRNRLISGLSDALVVIEAPQRSGTTITANAALEQGREVFAMPGAPDNPNCVGTNRLIADGARPILSPEDILSTYASKYRVDIAGMSRVTSKGLKELYTKVVADKKPENNKEIKRRTQKKEKLSEKAILMSEKREANRNALLDSLSEDVRKVYDAIGEGESLADEIVERSGLEPSKVLKALTKLEIKKLITALPGSRYRLR